MFSFCFVHLMCAGCGQAQAGLLSGSCDGGCDSDLLEGGRGRPATGGSPATARAPGRLAAFLLGCPRAPLSPSGIFPLRGLPPGAVHSPGLPCFVFTGGYNCSAELQSRCLRRGRDPFRQGFGFAFGVVVLYPRYVRSQ